MSASADRTEFELVDLTDVTLEELPNFDGSALAPAINRLKSLIDEPSELSSGYNPQRYD